MGRATAEKDLDFCGFVVMEYPLKMDSAFLVEELLRSSHRVVMITGDNALTACQVARDVKIIEKPVAFLRCEEASSSTPHSPSVNAYDLENKFVATVPATSVTSFSEHYSLCMNGETLSALVRGASTLSPAGMQRLVFFSFSFFLLLLLFSFSSPLLPSPNPPPPPDYSPPTSTPALSSPA